VALANSLQRWLLDATLDGVGTSWPERATSDPLGGA
jgi:hypothetical protein